MKTDYMVLNDDTLILYDKYPEELNDGLHRTTIEGYKGESRFKLIFEDKNRFFGINRIILLEEYGLLALDDTVNLARCKKV